MKENEKEVDELVEAIKQSDINIRYLHILKQVETNEDINDLINEIKRLQKEAVKEESLKHNQEVKELDQIINNKLKELNNIPLYKDYLETAEELNNLVTFVKDKIQYYINDLIL